ncbi:hypothetical protein [Acetobacter estunensis]|uniref:hypothetical protein n=1 Tax=Acetobacter estunensis TaxID=104097 RepID=UPI001C2DBFF6|nr:hypothetical protein [Acetobacter estunensis]MBV1835630.1 hypothetical protein [Acetobacter estunensis]MBV1836109.1 hypothetical protein [Acetobacter estunensis]
MIDHELPPELALEVLRSTAVELGFLITRPEDAGLLALGSDSSQQLLQRLSKQAQALPVEDVVQSAFQELGLSEFLTTECVHRIQSDVFLLLLARLRCLRLRDVRTEVLASWMEADQSSNGTPNSDVSLTAVADDEVRDWKDSLTERALEVEVFQERCATGDAAA